MYIPQTNSTNDYLKSHPELEPDKSLLVLSTGFQTAGRGQQGNHWESEPNQNLLFSLRYRPEHLAAQAGFVLSERIALAIVLSLPVEATIKWPNDIYVGNDKLAGILVENQLQGEWIACSILGVGLNVNQTHFVSDAPNPTSLRLLTGQEYDPSALLDAIVERFEQLGSWTQEQLHTTYMDHLYRRQGYHPYVPRPVDNSPTMNQTGLSEDVFEARIVEVTSQGELVLQTRQGEQRTYHFKQIRYVFY